MTQAPTSTSDSQRASADQRRLRIDAATVLAGVVLPAACFAVDHAMGQHIAGASPAGILMVYVLGCAALILPSVLDNRSKIWSIVAGALAVSALAVCLIALPISLFAVGTAYVGIVESGHWLDPLRLEVLVLSALGLCTLWTARVFVRRVYAVLKADVNSRAFELGLLGAVSLVAIVVIADQIDRWWVASQVREISRTNPGALPTTLAKLSAYPLCGPERCAKLVCKRLFAEFPGPNGFAFPPEIAAAQISTLDAYFRRPALYHCGWLASLSD